MPDLKERVFRLIGEASVCWEGWNEWNVPGGRVFDSTRAKQIGDDFLGLGLGLGPGPGLYDPEQLAQLFHETYERLAPEYHYQTRKASAVAWKDVPKNNKRLMIAVASEILERL